MIPILNSISRMIFASLANTTLQMTFLISLIALIIWLFRIRSPATRYALWKSFALALKDYTVQQETQDYLPLAIGNRWVYGREDLDEQEYVSDRVLQVRRRDEQGMYYLSHYDYVYH